MDDRFAWLEDVEGDDALAWVRARNAEAEEQFFGTADYTGLRSGILDVLEADDRIAMPSRHGERVFNFWTDAAHRRGILRSTTWDDYRAGNPDWTTLLDIDALSADEGESWVFAGSATRRPDRRRSLIDLSPGGSDASVTREFDLNEARFVPPEEGGFVRPAGKGWLEWIDDDTVYVGADFGPDTMTTSGYPRTVRRWERGTPFADAPVVFEGDADDVAVHVHVSTFPGHPHHVFFRRVGFFRTRFWVLRYGEMVVIDVPEESEIDVHGRWLTVRPRVDWTVEGRTHPAGSLLAAELDSYLAGDKTLTVVFEPTATSALAGDVWTRNRLILRISEHVRDRLEVADPDDGWSRTLLAGAPDLWSVVGAPVDPDETDDCFLVGNDSVTPATLFHVAAGGAPEVLRRAPSRFDASGMEIEQHFAVSADGTRVPYFVVGPQGRAGSPLPTLLYGYGGFEATSTPSYSGAMGRSWLSRGGRYVIANIRGGGEYGPGWHRAGLRDQRHRVYEDFEAVARDLIDGGFTTAPQLGIRGGSNGGLLVGNMYVRAPELFGAVVCQVPLLDMKRFSHLLAGASWMAEYGDPDVPEDWEFMKTFSPYHLIEPERSYPPILFTTSTKDDRVHPGHARKMAAALLDAGYPVTYWENIEGGHGGAADAGQTATMEALAYAFLHHHLSG